MAKKPCATCMAINAVLRAAKVPAPVAKAVSNSPAARRADQKIRRGGKRIGQVRTVRKASEYQKKLQKHLRIERDKATKKDGSFRKGMNQAKVMARAHKCVKREIEKEMKVIRTYTCRGAILCTSASTGFTERIYLDDMNPKTAFRITRFRIGNDVANSGSDCIGKLSTREPTDTSDAFWDWGDNSEIAWASLQQNATVTPAPGEPFNLVDRDNLVCGDLFVTVRTRDINSPEVFYYIEMEQVQLDEWRHVIGQISNLSQSGSTGA